jgi:hypothetical protein
LCLSPTNFQKLIICFARGFCNERKTFFPLKYEATMVVISFNEQCMAVYFGVKLQNLKQKVVEMVKKVRVKHIIINII